jgi:hypothetical protein
MDSLAPLKEQISLEEPMLVSNLMLFPITAKAPSNDYKFHTLHHGIMERSVVVSEAGGGHHSVLINNKEPERPLLIIDGEGISGGKQNRIAVSSMIIKPQTSMRVPVYCCEEGRWSGSHNFSSASTIAYPAIRRLNTGTMTYSKGMSGSQHSVWGEIRRKSRTMKTHSPTKSMQNIYEEKEDELKSYRDYEPMENQIGFLAATQKRLLCVDIFYNTDVFLNFFNRLLTSYALDGLEDSQTGIGGFSIEEWKNFFYTIFTAALVHRVKKYNEYRYAWDSGFGKALFLKDRLIHASFFHSKS